MRQQQANNIILTALREQPEALSGAAGAENRLYETLYERLWPCDQESARQDPYLEEMLIEHTIVMRDGANVAAFRLTETRRGHETTMGMAFRRAGGSAPWEVLQAGSRAAEQVTTRRAQVGIAA